MGESGKDRHGSFYLARSTRRVVWVAGRNARRVRNDAGRALRLLDDSSPDRNKMKDAGLW